MEIENHKEEVPFAHYEGLFRELDPRAVKYKKETPYAVEAMVLRSAVPSGMHISPISIEELFVFMVKEAK